MRIETTEMKMRLICTKIDVHVKLIFIRMVSTQTQKITRKWPINLLLGSLGNNMFFCYLQFVRLNECLCHAFHDDFEEKPRQLQKGKRRIHFATHQALMVELHCSREENIGLSYLVRNSLYTFKRGGL